MRSVSLLNRGLNEYNFKASYITVSELSSSSVETSYGVSDFLSATTLTAEDVNASRFITASYLDCTLEKSERFVVGDIDINKGLQSLCSIIGHVSASLLGERYGGLSGILLVSSLKGSGYVLPMSYMESQEHIHSLINSAFIDAGVSSLFSGTTSLNPVSFEKTDDANTVRLKYKEIGGTSYITENIVLSVNPHFVMTKVSENMTARQVTNTLEEHDGYVRILNETSTVDVPTVEGLYSAKVESSIRNVPSVVCLSSLDDALHVVTLGVPEGEQTAFAGTLYSTETYHNVVADKTASYIHEHIPESVRTGVRKEMNKEDTNTYIKGLVSSYIKEHSTEISKSIKNSVRQKVNALSSSEEVVTSRFLDYARRKSLGYELFKESNVREAINESVSEIIRNTMLSTQHGEYEVGTVALIVCIPKMHGVTVTDGVYDSDNFVIKALCLSTSWGKHYSADLSVISLEDSYWTYYLSAERHDDDVDTGLHGKWKSILNPTGTVPQSDIDAGNIEAIKTLFSQNRYVSDYEMVVLAVRIE